MIKRLIIGAALALMLTSATNVTYAELPWPDCLPCPEW
jgi:hypothetical protein